MRAAGGIVTRPAGDGCGDREVLLVHRPRYDDWTFPKGKCDPGETDEAAAVREVREETGYACALGVEAGTTRYVDNRNRPKVVRYWHMTVEHGAFEPNGEVDHILWLTREAARARLTYEHDRDLLDQAR